MCAKAIANLKDTSAVTALLYCLNNKDENYKVRLSCADALGRIGDRYAVAPLIEVVKDEDDVMLITDKGIIIRLEVPNISVLGRSTQGVTLMKTNDGGKVVSIAKISPDEGEDK